MKFSGNPLLLYPDPPRDSSFVYPLRILRSLRSNHERLNCKIYVNTTIHVIIILLNSKTEDSRTRLCPVAKPHLFSVVFPNCGIPGRV